MTVGTEFLKRQHVGRRSVESIRQDFPLLCTGDGAKIAYLDSAATSQKPKLVLEAISAFYTEANGGVHRALHSLSAEATRRYEHARERVASFIGAESARTIVFTRGTTESINLVATAWGGRFLREGDVVLLSEMEHHANLIPWQMLSDRAGVKLAFLPFDSEGTLDISSLDALWSDRVRLVSIIHTSNVLGTVNDVAYIARYAHEKGVPVLVDVAQSVSHREVNVSELGCDFLAFSGHKMLGPMGIGVLYAREEVLQAMPPYMGGGSMVRSAWLDRAVWNDAPHRFEAGTPNVGGAVGLEAAMDYLDSVGLDAIAAYERDLTSYACTRLRRVPGVTVYGPETGRGALVSFSIDGVHPHDAAQFLDRDGIAVRAGHHCAHPLTRKLGVAATVRASFSLYSTFSEVDRLITGIERTQEFFAHGIR